MANNLLLVCPHCHNQVKLAVDIKNVYGSIQSSLTANKIYITCGHLVAKGVVISGTKFVCLYCNRTISKDDLKIYSALTEKIDSIENFVILRATHKETNKKSQPVILHESEVDEYIKDAEKAGYTIYKRTAKLTLNTEVGNG